MPTNKRKGDTSSRTESEFLNAPCTSQNTTRTFTHQGGPVQQYLGLVGKTRDEYEEALRCGDVNAVTLFAAELLFGRLLDVERRLEQIEQQHRRAAL